MGSRGRSPEDEKVVEQVLGYLNFSSGAPDPRFLANLNRVFEWVGEQRGDPAVWRAAWESLEGDLARLASTSATFQNAEQAACVLRLVREQVIPGGDRICGYHINPFDPQDIAEYVIDILRHPDLALMMGKNGRNRVAEQFTWEIVSEKTLAVYRELVDR